MAGFDVFIQVVDRLRFLTPGEAEAAAIETLVQDGRLAAIRLVLTAPSFIGTGTMQRGSGLDEERLQVLGRGRLVTVRDKAEIFEGDGAERPTRRPD